jgi:tol-pal system protein YbgF
VTRTIGLRILFVGLTLFAGMAGPLCAQSQKDMLIRLQTDVDRLTQAQRDLQRSLDEKNAVLKTLLEQNLDAINKLNTALQSLQQANANTGTRIDNLATQVQAMADGLDEMNSRVGKLNQQLAETQSILQSMDAKLAPPVAPPTGETPAGPPPSAEVLYNNALRDFTGGKYDLARQQFVDYLKYYPETDLASNAQFYLGEIAFANKQYAESVTEYDKVLDNYPKSFKLGDARMKKGLALLELNQRAGAIRELREVVRRHPGSDAERRARAKLRELGVALPSGSRPQ